MSEKIDILNDLSLIKNKLNQKFPNEKGDFSLLDFCNIIEYNNKNLNGLCSIFHYPDILPSWYQQGSEIKKPKEFKKLDINIYFLLQSYFLPSNAFEKTIIMEIYTSFNNLIEQAILEGKSENNQPTGIKKLLKEENTVKFSKENIKEGLLQIYNKLNVTSRNYCCWIVNNKYISEITNLKNDITIKNGGFLLFGIPVIITTYMEETPFILGDFYQGYIIVDGGYEVRENKNHFPNDGILVSRFLGGIPIDNNYFYFAKLE